MNHNKKFFLIFIGFFWSSGIIMFFLYLYDKKFIVNNIGECKARQTRIYITYISYFCLTTVTQFYSIVMIYLKIKDVKEERDYKNKKKFDLYVTSCAEQLETYAKQNRPWTDRSTRARQGLKGTVTEEDHKYTIVLAHSVKYGKYLEFAHEQKYAIIFPTIKLKSPEIMEGFTGLIDSVKI